MPEFPKNICPIWGSIALTQQFDPFVAHVDSPRTGGAYSIDYMTAQWLPSLTNAQKAKLTSWLIDQRRGGVSEPRVYFEDAPSVISRPHIKVGQAIERFFLMLSSGRWRPGQNLDVDEGLREIAAWTESEDDAQALGMVEILKGANLIREIGTHQFSVTPEGFKRLDDIDNYGALSEQAFVAMWFDDTMNKPFSEGFEPGIRDAGYVPFRIDKKDHINKIDDEIISEIRRSRFLIADFTCSVQTVDGKPLPNARGGVYYEAGFAQGLNIPVIWTVRADCIEHVHFDVRQFAHILWREPDDLRSQLTQRIGAVIGRLA